MTIGGKRKGGKSSGGGSSSKATYSGNVSAVIDWMNKNSDNPKYAKGFALRALTGEFGGAPEGGWQEFLKGKVKDNGEVGPKAKLSPK